MSIAVYPKKSLTKPTGPLAINWGHPLAQGLQGCWLFNEGGGVALRNLVSKASDGVINSGGWTSGGLSGAALKFNGSSDFATLTTETRLNIGSNPLTVVFWALHSVEGFIVDKSDGNAANDGWWINTQSSDSTIDFVVVCNSANVRRGASEPSLNKWFQGVVTWDGSTSFANVHIYLNGAEASYGGTNQNGSGSHVETRDVQLAKSRGGSPSFLTGSIDHLLIYNRTLSLHEIQRLYVEPLAMIAPLTVSVRARIGTTPPVAAPPIDGWHPATFEAPYFETLDIGAA